MKPLFWTPATRTSSPRTSRTCSARGGRGSRTTTSVPQRSTPRRAGASSNTPGERLEMARVLIGATNYGVWAEELQAPWDALTEAGHSVTLATPAGKKPLPLKVSVDPEFVDPVQRYDVNPPEVCARVKQLV